MKEPTRARVAAVVGATIKKKKVSSVYDYSQGGHRSASAKVTDGKVSGYDYDTSSHFSGGGGGKLDFYDYDTSAHVQLKLNGNKFKGYCYHTGSHFSGTVKGSSISLYDYETGQHYNFSI
jgi:hypothetical protein